MTEKEPVIEEHREFKMSPGPKGWILTCSRDSGCAEIAAMMAAFNCTATINPTDQSVELHPILEGQPRPDPREVIAIYTAESPPAMLRTLVLRDQPTHLPATERRQ